VIRLAASPDCASVTLSARHHSQTSGTRAITLGRGRRSEVAMNLNEYVPVLMMLIPTGLLLGAVVLSLVFF